MIKHVSYKICFLLTIIAPLRCVTRVLLAHSNDIPMFEDIKRRAENGSLKLIPGQENPTDLKNYTLSAFIKTLSFLRYDLKRSDLSLADIMNHLDVSQAVGRIGLAIKVEKALGVPAPVYQPDFYLLTSKIKKDNSKDWRKIWMNDYAYYQLIKHRLVPMFAFASQTCRKAGKHGVITIKMLDETTDQERFIGAVRNILDTPGAVPNIKAIFISGCPQPAVAKKNIYTYDSSMKLILCSGEVKDEDYSDFSDCLYFSVSGSGYVGASTSEEQKEYQVAIVDSVTSEMDIPNDFFPPAQVTESEHEDVNPGCKRPKRDIQSI